MLEEKQLLNEKYETAKKELEEAIAKLEEQIHVEKSEKELHISKLERQITLSETKYMEEVLSLFVFNYLCFVYSRKRDIFIKYIQIVSSDTDNASGNN